MTTHTSQVCSECGTEKYLIGRGKCQECFRATEKNFNPLKKPYRGMCKDKGCDLKERHRLTMKQCVEHGCIYLAPVFNQKTQGKKAPSLEEAYLRPCKIHWRFSRRHTEKYA